VLETQPLAPTYRQAALAEQQLDRDTEEAIRQSLGQAATRQSDADAGQGSGSSGAGTNRRARGIGRGFTCIPTMFYPLDIVPVISCFFDVLGR
jgi:hypothetical protein